MKALLIFALIAFSSSLTLKQTSNKDVAEIVKCFLKSQVLWDDLADLIEVIQTGSGFDIFNEFIKILPDWIKGIQKCMEEEFDKKLKGLNLENKPAHEIASCILRSQILFDDIVKIIEAFEKKDVLDIICTFFEVIPDFIENIRRCVEDESEEVNLTLYESSVIEKVKCFLKSQVLFNDIAKLIDVIATHDKLEIVLTVFEIIPDFVRGIKKCLEL